MRAAEVCARAIDKFAKTVDRGSILGRNRFGTKLRKLNKQYSVSTIAFGCWPWAASNTAEQGYFVKMLLHAQGHAQGHDKGHYHDHDLDHDLDHDKHHTTSVQDRLVFSASKGV